MAIGMEEHDVIELTIDVPESGLKAGQQGTIVHMNEAVPGSVLVEIEDDVFDVPVRCFRVIWRVRDRQTLPQEAR